MGSLHARSARQTRDLNQRIAADRHLQSEIDKGIESLAGDLPAQVGTRLARVLSTVLEPAWSEHTCFQDEALFPLLARRALQTPDIGVLLDRLGGEHAEITEQHREVSAFLTSSLAGRRRSNAELSACLLTTLDLRRRHHSAEATLVHMVPVKLDAEDCDTLDAWTATRKATSFPVNLILDFWE